MSSIGTPSLFDCCRGRLDELLDAHAPIGVVERAIDAYALGGEEKAALWLWACGRREGLVTAAVGRLVVGQRAVR